MSRILKTSFWGLAIAAITAFSAIPASAAPSGGTSGHIMLVRGGGGGGGGGGGMGGRGGGGFSGGSGHSFAGPSVSGGTRSFSSPSVNGGARSFNGNASNFANGNRSFSNFSNNNFRNGWNNGHWAWNGNGNWNHWNNGRGWGWGGWGYPWWGWGLGWGVGWWPGYYYGYDNGPYYNYYGDNYAYDNTSYNTGYNNGAANTPPPTPTTADNQNDQGQSEFLGQAIQNFQSGDYKNAMRMAEHAVVDNPRDAEAHEVISLAAFAQKDYRTAATEAHAVVALGGVPSWEQVYSIYQNADTYTDQLRALESYAKANPKSPEAQFLLGVLYMSNGYANEAHEHLAQAAQMTPKDQIAQELVKGGNGQAPSTANRPTPPSAPVEQ